MNEKYLPIGSVVLLKNATKRLMVTGFLVSSKEFPEKVFDYSGCLYPEGIITSEQTALFDHEQIEKIYATGFSDLEEKSFKAKLINKLNSK